MKQNLCIKHFSLFVFAVTFFYHTTQSVSMINFLGGPLLKIFLPYLNGQLEGTTNGRYTEFSDGYTSTHNFQGQQERVTSESKIVKYI